MIPKLLALSGAPFLVTTDPREIVRDGSAVAVVDGYTLAPSACELIERGPVPRFEQNVPASDLVELEAVAHGEPQAVREARERGRPPRPARRQVAPADTSSPPAKPKGKRARG